MIDYNTADRIQLLKEVTRNKDKQEEADNQKLEDILCDRYFDFVRVCEEVESNRNEIKSISSTLNEDGVRFEIEKK